MALSEPTMSVGRGVTAPAGRDPGAPLAARHADAAHERFRATRKFGSLDGLRALSILAVMWSHAGDGAPGGPLGSLPARGGFGVDLFFVISGFLITTLLLREREAIGRVSLRDFYVRRALRIFPLYFAVLAFNVAFVWAAHRGSADDEQFWNNLPHFLTYTYNWVDPFCVEHGIFSISWSLATEEQFYLVWPLLLVIAPRRIHLAVLALVIGLDVVYSFPAVWRPIGQQPFAERFLAGLSTPICLGVLMALALHTRRGFRIAAAVLARRGAPAVSLALLLVVLSLSDWMGHRAAWCLAWILLGCLVGACVVREDNGLAAVLRWRPLAWIGLVSYGLYLLHPLANSAALRLLPRIGLTPDYGIERFVACTLLSTAMAGASYYFFERRFLRLKDCFTPARRHAPAAGGQAIDAGAATPLTAGVLAAPGPLQTR